MPKTAPTTPAEEVDDTLIELFGTPSLKHFTRAQIAAITFYKTVRGDDTFDRNAIALLVLQAFGLKPEVYLFAETKRAKTTGDERYARAALTDVMALPGFKEHIDAIREAYNKMPRPWNATMSATDAALHPTYRSEADLLKEAYEQVCRKPDTSKAKRFDGSKDCIAFDNLLSAMEQAFSNSGTVRIVTDRPSYLGYVAKLSPTAACSFHGASIDCEDYMAAKYPGQMHFYNAAGEIVAVVDAIN